MRRLVILLAVVAVGLGACKADRKQCEIACRNYATLVYPKMVEIKVAKLPVEKQDAERRKLLALFDSELENGVDLCINKCASARNDDMINCMKAAKTADAAMKCTEE